MAITVSPPIPSDRRALVRELRSLSDVLRSQASPTTDVPQPHGSGNAAPSQDESNEADKNLEERKGRECLVVDPRFELYQGLETGKPSFVQLRVHLYAETEHYNEYIDEVNNLFSRWIFGHEGEHIVIAEPVDRYDGLRDFSHLQGGIRVDYTLVFQVDEFWAENNPMQLLNQYPYLWAETVDKHGKQAIVEDPFGVFQPTQYYNRKKLGGMTKGIERFRFFHVDGHDYERYPHRLRVDKVPYLWDFGFLLCDKEAWESASTRDVPTGRTLKVGDVWRSVQLDTKESRTWRDFLAACKVVAEVANAPYAFDVSMVATETFSCLVLEMWASEIAAKVGCEEAKKIFPPNRDANFADGLLKLLKDHRFRLFKAWLLLADVFQPNQCFAKDNVFQSRTVHKSAIAARHWYSTATAVVRSEKEGRIWIPCRLPGTHSVRGDWFLAIASGSRSPRLGQLAIDLLCTRRANIVRMQSGLGLPVRDWKESGAQELWTPFCKQGKTPGMPQARLNFNDLKKLGASDAVDGGFSWLWRTLLKGYDRHARTWQRWLASIIAEMRDALRAAGVQRYDQLKEPSDASGDREWHEFRKRCEWLVQSLERATLECDPGHETSDRT
ncbi:MAG: hypothetical protein HYS13_12430 [Planctomycetia bacterium]|nr:hypothetical protein [Planctomycetia bacterium]